MKTKMTKAERNWVLYDVGNSAFVLLVSTIMPIYFNYLAGNAGLSSVDYLAYWGGYCFNLNKMPRSSLIEVGAQTNTVAEAKNAMVPLGAILYKVLIAQE